MGSFDPSITISLGDTLPFLWEKFLKVIGRDPTSIALEAWFSQLQQMGLNDASTVQCIGMHTPIPLNEIYRPTRLLWHEIRSNVTRPVGQGGNQVQTLDQRESVSRETEAITTEAFLAKKQNAAIIAGPGWGKTTFLRHLFLEFISNVNTVPVLLTLRRNGAVSDLTRLVDTLSSTTALNKGGAVLLLVDGYDEISLRERKKVSAALNRFVSQGLGRLYLACREFYDLIDLNLPTVKIAPLTNYDQLQFIAAFMKAYGSEINADKMLGEMRSRGLADLLSHPLLLTMVCIVQTGNSTLYSRSPLILIDRAIDTLSFRWDEGRGIDREQYSRLDGRARLHCLMRIAYQSLRPRMDESVVMRHARQQLDLFHCDELDERKVMLETARFYGILVPTAGTEWEFVHRTLHDYLAARFMVETGLFKPETVSTWNSRTSYAACLSPDATESMLAAMRQKESLPALIEMVANDAPCNHRIIAAEIITHFSHDTESILFNSSQKFLNDFVLYASTEGTEEGKQAFVDGALEFRRRTIGLNETALRQGIKTYGYVISAEGYKGFTRNLSLENS